VKCYYCGREIVEPIGVSVVGDRHMENGKEYIDMDTMIPIGHCKTYNPECELLQAINEIGGE